MKILYYDCFCGISGDMNLGALVDLGVDGEYLKKELSKLKLDSEYEIKIKKGLKKGISGTKVDVVLTGGETSSAHEHGRHDHGGNNRRNLKDIESVINGSDLNERVKARSIEMFSRIADAEAKVHGRPVSEIHFHEVGAIDSIVDIVGAAIALDYLNVDKIMASTVQVGGGFARCEHGLLPVPAPATAELLKGIPLKTGIVPFETTTPTGAAILVSNVEEFTDRVEFTIEGTGYGLGNMDFEIPNVLRVFLGRSAAGEEAEEQYIIETNIDDMNPEFYSYVEERLFEAGALDVFKTPIIMKKGRPAVKLSVLTDRVNESKMQELIFRETTSIGIRKYKVDKIMLDRKIVKTGTRFGEVTVKHSYYRGELVNYKLEYEECRKIAEERNIPISEVYKAIQSDMNDGKK